MISFRINLFGNMDFLLLTTLLLNIFRPFTDTGLNDQFPRGRWNKMIKVIYILHSGTLNHVLPI